jgi:hypothetical protein
LISHSYQCVGVLHTVLLLLGYLTLPNQALTLITCNQNAMKMDVSTCEYSAPSREDFLSSEDTKQQSHLCSSCSSIDFKNVFTLPSAQVSRQGVAITETRKDIDRECGLCLFVALLIPLNTGSNSSLFEILGPGYHFRTLDSLWPLRLRRTEARIAANPSIVAAVFQGRSNRILNRSQLNEAVSRGLLVPVA